MFVRGTVGRAVSDRASRGLDGRHRYCGLVTRETLSRQLKQSDGGLKACSAVRKLTPSSEQADVKNQSFYAVVVTLLVLITVAMWQFFSLARSEGLMSPYSASGQDSFGGKKTMAVKPK